MQNIGWCRSSRSAWPHRENPTKYPRYLGAWSVWASVGHELGKAYVAHKNLLPSLVQGRSSGGWVSVGWNPGKVTALLGDRQVIVWEPSACSGK